jgi:hypothetical protein
VATAVRCFRIPDDLWDAIVETAALEGMDVSSFVRAALVVAVER